MHLVSKGNFIIAFLLFSCIPQTLIGMKKMEGYKKVEGHKQRIEEQLPDLEELDIFFDDYAEIYSSKLPQYLNKIEEIRKTKDDPDAYQELFEKINTKIESDPSYFLDFLENKLNEVTIIGKNIEELKQIKEDITRYRELGGEEIRYADLLTNIEKALADMKKAKGIGQRILELFWKPEIESRKMPTTPIPTDIETMKRLNLCKLDQCVIELGTENELKRQLLQIKMAEQVGAYCGGISLINILWVEKYTNSGNTNKLTYLHDRKNVERILDKLGCENWVDINKVKVYIKNAKSEGYSVDNIDAISSVLVLDKAKAESLFKEEVSTGQNLKNKVRKGFKKDYFFQAIIIGDEEVRGDKGLGHYFAFVIIKSTNQVQYIIIDSLDTNHLTDDGYERRRINYLISQLETGEAKNLIPHTKYKEMVTNLKNELGQFKGDYEDLLEQTMNQEEFFAKYSHDGLMTLQRKIKEYQALTEEQDFEDELDAIVQFLKPAQEIRAEEIVTEKMNSFKDIKKGNDPKLKKRRLQTLIIGVGADEKVLGSEKSHELMELFTTEWCKLLK